MRKSESQRFALWPCRGRTVPAKQTSELRLPTSPNKSAVGGRAPKPPPRFLYPLEDNLFPRGKEVKIQGETVRATRKPKSVLRKSEEFLMRYAARRKCGLSNHEPPRSTRQDASVQFVVRAAPSLGIVLRLSVQQSSTHSQALPCMSCNPHRFGAFRLPTATVRFLHSPLLLPL